MARFEEDKSGSRPKPADSLSRIDTTQGYPKGLFVRLLTTNFIVRTFFDCVPRRTQIYIHQLRDILVTT